MIGLTIFLTLGLFTLGFAQTKQVNPKGIYKEIDVERHNKIVEILNSDNATLKAEKC